MPITKSAKKQLRQNIRRRLRNLKYKKRIKQERKVIQKLIKEGKTKEAEEKIPTFYKIVDKAAKENVIKKNKASRMKSGIVKFVKKAKKS